VISIQARSGGYGLELFEESASVQPEEAALVLKRDEKFLGNLPVSRISAARGTEPPGTHEHSRGKTAHAESFSALRYRHVSEGRLG
jgi:hypothetical protein